MARAATPIQKAARGPVSSGFHLRRISWAHRLAAALMVVVGVISAGGAVAYYAGSHIRDLKQGAATHPLWRYADATDGWLESIRKPSFWKKGASNSRNGRSDRSRSETRSSRSSRDSRARNARQTNTGGGSSRSTERRARRSAPDSGRSETVVRRAIREPVESGNHRASYTKPVTRNQTIRYYSVAPQHVGTYRTMCVRLCDGYYWPVSFSALKHNFARDSEKCEQSCDSPVALYTYKNGEDEPENMVNLEGQPYIELQSAFLYRASYDSSCKCRPHPWEDASRRRHLSYQLADQRR